MKKPTAKAKPKPPTFSPAEIRKFRAIKTGAEILDMKPAEAKKYMKWHEQRSAAISNRASKKKYGW